MNGCNITRYLKVVIIQYTYWNYNYQNVFDLFYHIVVKPTNHHLRAMIYMDYKLTDLYFYILLTHLHFVPCSQQGNVAKYFISFYSTLKSNMLTTCVYTTC